MNVLRPWTSLFSFFSLQGKGYVASGLCLDVVVAQVSSAHIGQTFVESCHQILPQTFHRHLVFHHTTAGSNGGSFVWAMLEQGHGVGALPGVGEQLGGFIYSVDKQMNHTYFISIL